MYVLVLSGSAMSAETIGTLLEYRGHSPIAVAEVADAAAALSFAQFDAIVVDLDAFPADALAELRGRAVSRIGRPVPVIGVSERIAPAAPDVRPRGGIDRLVRKPIDPLDLYAAIDPLLSRRSPTPGAHPLL